MEDNAVRLPSVRSVETGIVDDDGDERHADRVRSCTAFPRTPSEKRIFYWVIGIKGLLVMLSLALMWVSYTHGNWLIVVVEESQTWIKNWGIGGPLLFLTMYVGLTVVFVPAEVLSVSSGFIFPTIYGYYGGFALAFVLCLVGQLGSTGICFLLARRVLHNPIHLFLGHYVFFQAFMAAVSEGGTVFVALIRLSPAVPFTLSNYLLGLTRLKLSSVLIGACAATPLILIMIWIGTIIGSIRDVNNGVLRFSPLRIFLMCLGLIFALVAVLFIGFKTKQKLDEAATALRENSAARQSVVPLISVPTEKEPID